MVGSLSAGLLLADEAGAHLPSVDDFLPPEILFQGTPFAINRIILIRIVATIVLLVVLGVTAKRAKLIPGRWQGVVEYGLDFVRDKVVYDVMGEARVKLFREVFSGKTLNKVTMRLAEHATCNLRRRRYLETIQWLINKFSRHMGESMVTVTTATPLKKEQIKRLVEVYSAKVGRQVHINSVVDPTVLGGMRIQVGDEVTDNTVVAQLQNLHRKVQTEATPA